LFERLAMPDSAPPLHVYPHLWTESRNQYPHDHQWPDQLRCLCALARAYRKANPKVVNALPAGERLFLQSLDQIDVEDFIETLKSDFPGEPNPMLRIDPSDPGVTNKEDYPELYSMNGHKFDARAKRARWP
jgi:hypothetical protein